MAGRHRVQPEMNCYGDTGENQCVNQILFWVKFHGKILNLGFWKAKILNCAKIVNPGFWKANILKSAKILNSGFGKLKS